MLCSIVKLAIPRLQHFSVAPMKVPLAPQIVRPATCHVSSFGERTLDIRKGTYSEWSLNAVTHSRMLILALTHHGMPDRLGEMVLYQIPFVNDLRSKLLPFEIGNIDATTDTQIRNNISVSSLTQPGIEPRTLKTTPWKSVCKRLDHRGRTNYLLGHGRGENTK